MVNRRQFLKLAGGGAASAAFAGFNLSVCARALAQQNTAFEDYKAIVCVFFAGGMDSFNLLVPNETQAYAQYVQTRGEQNQGGVALSPEELLPLTGVGGGTDFALHSAMPSMQSLYNQGKLGFVANLGTLVTPTTMQEYKNQSVPLPAALFSHSDQIRHHQSAYPQAGSNTGWAGRVEDLFRDTGQATGAIPLNISTSGNNLLQSGQQSVPYIISSAGATSFRGRGRTGSRDPERIRYLGLNQLLSQSSANLFEQTYLSEIQHTLDIDESFSSAFEQAVVAIPDPAGSSSGLANQLRGVARAIWAGKNLGLKRQLFFVQLGGWDHHQALITTQRTLLAQVDAALAELWQNLALANAQDEVVTYTSSEFARTLRSNGRGTDHAWGGNAMVMGGPVKGGQVHGQYPELVLGAGQDVGTNGRLLPTLSLDHYFGEIAQWFGVSPGNLDLILPNVTHFYDPYTSSNPIGFL